MSRKDTIIVAVLVNAGLLIVLFASALKSGGFSQDVAAVPAAESPVQVEMAAQKDVKAVQGDEVDQVLQQLSQAPALGTASSQTPLEPIAQPVVAPAQSSFASDLQAISTQETPVAAMPMEVRSPAETVEVRVKKGDALEKIARQHHCTVDEIMKHNRLSSTNLRIGQVLKIPGKSVKKASTSDVATSATGAKYYTIKNGDNPWTIAVKHRMKVEDLLKLNGLNEEKARKLKPGDQIRVQ